MGQAVSASKESFASGSAPRSRSPGRDATVAVVASRPFTKLVERACPDAPKLREESLRILLPQYGLSPKALEHDDARVPHSLSIELLERSAWLLGTPTLALDAVRAWTLGDQGLGDYLNATCDTVEECFRTITRHVGLLNDGLRFTLDDDGGIVRLRYEVTPGVIDHPWIAEFSLGKVLTELRNAFRGQDDFRPIRARFTHRAPAYAKQYSEVFFAPVEFDDSICALEFSSQVLSKRLPTADPNLHRLLLRQAQELLKPPEGERALVDRVREAIVAELVQGGAPQNAVARRLGMSTATLRRRLELEHGTRYSDVLEQLRRERVASQLVEGRATIDAISYGAGFSRTTTFYRAFKRWFGCTPGDYRRQHGQPG